MNIKTVLKIMAVLLAALVYLYSPSIEFKQRPTHVTYDN